MVEITIFSCNNSEAAWAKTTINFSICTAEASTTINGIFTMKLLHQMSFSRTSTPDLFFRKGINLVTTVKARYIHNASITERQEWRNTKVCGLWLFETGSYPVWHFFNPNPLRIRWPAPMRHKQSDSSLTPHKYQSSKQPTMFSYPFPPHIRRLLTCTSRFLSRIHPNPNVSSL